MPYVEVVDIEEKIEKEHGEKINVIICNEKERVLSLH